MPTGIPPGGIRRLSVIALLQPFLDPLVVADRDTNMLQPLRACQTWPQSVLVQSVEADIAARRPVRYIVLKARQIGMSTIIEALMFAMSVLEDRMSGVVVSHRNDSNEHLLKITRTYFDNWWGKGVLLNPSSMARNQIGWRENGSTVKVATAKNTESGRGMTLRFVHGSEVAFWPDPEALTTGLNQTVPRAPLTFFFLESTANGVGDYFHRTWRAAVQDEVEYKPLFFAWWQHPHYRASRIGYSALAGQPLVPTDDEERFLLKFLRQRGIGDSDATDRMVWRRQILATECEGDIDKFHQEYPTTDEEAFVSTGRNVFPIAYLRAVYEPMVPRVGKLVSTPAGVQFVEHPYGPLRVYRTPVANRTWGSYLVGGDPAFGGVAGDFSCAQVFNRNSWEQCAVYRDKCDAASLGEQMVLLGKYYNDAMLAPEATKGGGATVATIRARGYPNIYIHTKSGSVRGQPDTLYGFHTNSQTKPELVGNLQKAIYDGSRPESLKAGLGVRVHDKMTFEELKGYVKLDGDKFGNAGRSDHDDTVMAVAIAVTCIMYEAGALLGYGLHEPRYDELAPVARPAEPPAALTEFEEKLSLLGVGAAPTVHQSAGTTLLEQAPTEPPWLGVDEQLDDF